MPMEVPVVVMVGNAPVSPLQPPGRRSWRNEGHGCAASGGARGPQHRISRRDRRGCAAASQDAPEDCVWVGCPRGQWRFDFNRTSWSVTSFLLPIVVGPSLPLQLVESRKDRQQPGGGPWAELRDRQGPAWRGSVFHSIVKSTEVKMILFSSRSARQSGTQITSADPPRPAFWTKCGASRYDYDAADTADTPTTRKTLTLNTSSRFTSDSTVGPPLSTTHGGGLQRFKVSQTANRRRRRRVFLWWIGVIDRQNLRW